MSFLLTPFVLPLRIVYTTKYFLDVDGVLAWSGPMDVRSKEDYAVHVAHGRIRDRPPNGLPRLDENQ